MAFLAERFPAVAALLEKGAGQQFSVVRRDGEPTDLSIDGQLLYGGDARAYTEGQIAAYIAKPLRLHMNALTNSGLVSPICVELVAALERELTTRDHTALPIYPPDSPAFLVVFGLGLGHHLARLARHTKARWLILVEPIAGFFEHSLDVVDWQDLARTFEERGGEIHVVTEIDPAAIASSVAHIMSKHGIAYADGSWIFTHYPFWAFADARKRLHEAIEFAFVNRGFFEDELRMMTNAVANFAGNEFHLLEGKRRLARPETAVIAGAGPSLDESVEALHRVRDRVVLFSCGTALRALLKNGIVPDYHCELENVPEVCDVMCDTAHYGDLSRITLIASATVDPRVPSFFGRHIFFFRDAVSSTRILGGSFSLLAGASPTCVNAGLAAASSLGFTNFALFGTDCGVRPGGKVHAEGTIYRDLGMWQDRERSQTHPIEVQGNFGGVIRTDWVYDACRLMLARAIATYRCAVVNCSDGALIPGARPCVPDALGIEGPAIDRTELFPALDAGMRHFAPGALLAGTDLHGVRGAAQRMFRRVDLALDELAAGAPDFAAAYDRVRALVAELDGGFDNADAMITGTLNALPRIAMFYGLRITDPSLRRAFYDRYIAEFRAVAASMGRRTAALFDELDIRLAA